MLKLSLVRNIEISLECGVEVRVRKLGQRAEGFSQSDCSGLCYFAKDV
jgi:hypothetical protein